MARALGSDVGNARAIIGRLGGHALKPGRYRLKAVPRNPAGSGRAVFAKFPMIPAMKAAVGTTDVQTPGCGIAGQLVSSASENCQEMPSSRIT